MLLACGSDAPPNEQKKPAQHPSDSPVRCTAHSRRSSIVDKLTRARVQARACMRTRPTSRPPLHERLSGKPARPHDSATSPDDPAHKRRTGRRTRTSSTMRLGRRAAGRCFRWPAKFTKQDNGPEPLLKSRLCASSVRSVPLW